MAGRRSDPDTPPHRFQGHKLSALTVYVAANERGQHAERGDTTRERRVNEASERTVLDDALVDQLLAAVDGPALVCDEEGVVRAWNDAMADLAADRTLVDTPVRTVVDWVASDPTERAVAAAERTTAIGRFTDGGGRYTATARPLTRGNAVDTVGAVGAVVTFDEVADDADHEAADDAINEATPGDSTVYEEALAAAPDAVFALDTDYRIRLVSEVFESLTGIPTAAVTGEPLDCLVDHGIIDGETLERTKNAFDAAFGGEQLSFVFRPETVDGTVVAENHLAPIRRDGEVVGAVAVVRDVTDRTRAEAALRESRERLQTIVETLPVAMLVVDGDGRIDFLHGLDFATLDCDRDDLLGADVGVLAEEYGTVVAGCRRALEGEGVTETVTIGGQTYEGSIEPVRSDDGDEVTGAIATAVDVTDREEREQRLRAVIESSPDAISVKDLDGRYQVVNEAMLEAADCTRASLHGKTAEEVFDEEIAARLERNREAVLESESARVTEERFPGEDQAQRFRLTTAPLWDPDGEIEGTVTIARDVTAIERQHAELERLTAIQGLVHESVRALTDATTRPEIEETVCGRLVDSEFYRAAWVGSLQRRGDPRLRGRRRGHPGVPGVGDDHRRHERQRPGTRWDGLPLGRGAGHRRRPNRPGVRTVPGGRTRPRLRERRGRPADPRVDDSRHPRAVHRPDRRLRRARGRGIRDARRGCRVRAERHPAPTTPRIRQRPRTRIRGDQRRPVHGRDRRA